MCDVMALALNVRDNTKLPGLLLTTFPFTSGYRTTQLLGTPFTLYLFHVKSIPGTWQCDSLESTVI